MEAREHIDDDTIELDDFPISFDTFSPSSTEDSSSECDEIETSKMITSTVLTERSTRTSNDTWYFMDMMEQIQALDAATGGPVRKVLKKLHQRAYAPFPLDDWVVFCHLCNQYSTHDTAHHLCHVCHHMGEHKSEECIVSKDLHCSFCPTLTGHTTSDHCCLRCYQRGQHTSCSRRILMVSYGSVLYLCKLCDKLGLHETSEHVCRKCNAKGQHRSADCPQINMSSSPSSYAAMLDPMPSIKFIRSQLTDTAIPTLQTFVKQTVQSTTSSLAEMRMSSSALSDMEMRLRQTLQRLGVWGAGSQTPISTPFPQRFSPSSTSERDYHFDSNPIVVSYHEGSSVVPERILKYMRLIMHAPVSTNAFHVVVQASAWETKRPGMITPRSYPPSPRTRIKYRDHMDTYTQSVIAGARAKLLALQQEFNDESI